MKIRYGAKFIKQYKKAGKKIQDKTDKVLVIFSKDQRNPQLRNHSLSGKYQGHRSIDITGDWRAIYKEMAADNDSYAYFIALDTHSQLYK